MCIRDRFLGRSLATNDGIYSEMLKQQFDEEVRTIVDKCYEDAVGLIHNNQHKINILSNILVNTVTMSGDFVQGYTNMDKVNATNFQE